MDGAGPETASEVIYDDVPSEDPLSPAEGEWPRHKDARPLTSLDTRLLVCDVVVVCHQI